MTAQSDLTRSAPPPATAKYGWQSSIKVRRFLTSVMLYTLVIAGAVVLTLPLAWHHRLSAFRYPLGPLTIRG